jgi:hypothetical protein
LQRVGPPLRLCNDGLSRETKGVKWTPIGLVVDVTI